MLATVNTVEEKKKSSNTTSGCVCTKVPKFHRKIFWFVLEKLKFLMLGVCTENYCDSVTTIIFFSYRVTGIKKLHATLPFMSKDQNV